MQLIIASLASIAQGQAALDSAQQARKFANGLVQNSAAADDAIDAAQQEIEQLDAIILDLMEKLAAAHKKRVAASKRCHIKSAKRHDLDDDLQHMTQCTSNVLATIHRAKRQKLDRGGL